VRSSWEGLQIEDVVVIFVCRTRSMSTCAV
jgi:hypothetical protein